MASFAGTIETENLLQFKNPYLSPQVGVLNDGTLHTTVDDPEALNPDTLTAEGYTHVDQKQPISNTEFAGILDEKSTLAEDWFEKFHIIPKFIELGNVITVQVVVMEVFSAYREDTKDWNTFTNNAGEGVEITNLPTLPTSVGPLTGIDLILEVDVVGPPTVDSTLDFGFDGQTISVPITFDRIVLFVPKPEMPYDEELGFLTDIIPKKDGKEQRISLRKNPRQYFSWNSILEDGNERQRFQNILFEWQTRTYGIPIWHDMVRLTADALSGDGTLNVTSTDDADYRDDGYLMIYSDYTSFEVMQISAISTNLITLDGTLVNSFSSGTIVAPLRTGVIEGGVRGKRYVIPHLNTAIVFRIIDNDRDIADTSGFSSYDGKVLFDDGNAIISEMTEDFDQEVTIIDNLTGVTFQSSSWDHNKRITTKTFIPNNRSAFWNVRKVLHSLRGRQISFYIPTFSEDVTLDTDITVSQDLVNIVYSNYTNFVRQRSGRNIIRINFLDGSTPVIKEITDSSVASTTREVLTVDSNFTSGIAMADVSKIDFLELVRFNTDRIKMRHQKGFKKVRITAPIISVFD